MILPVLIMAISSAAPSWADVAKDGKVPPGASTAAALHELEIRIAGLPEDGRAKVKAVLVELAACPPTAEGIQAAWEKLNAALPGLQKPDWSGSSEHPNRANLRAAGMRVLHGLVARAKKDKKLKEAIRALPGLEPERLANLLEEAK